MSNVIRGPWPEWQTQPPQQPRIAVGQSQAVQTVQAVQTGLMPDFCTRCGRVLGDASPPEGKICLNCGHLNTRASLGKDY